MELTRPRTEELRERRAAAVARGVAITHDIFAVRGLGATLWDADGRSYADFTAGIGTLNLGHAHPRIVAALAAQAERLTHTCFQVAPYEGYVAVAERLAALTPGAFAKKALLVSTGSEATENAVKIARAATKRSGVVAFSYGYHGRTLLALAMTGKVAPYHQNFGPFPADVFHAPYPIERLGWTSERALAGLHELFETQIAPERVAAFIIEPVLGEGGFFPAPFDFLRELRRVADRHGIVLIADEVQTGFGRTGTMFASEQAGLVPDLVTLAKSLAGGLPLAAVVGRAAIVDAVEPGGLGGTFAGNPVACAAALATLDVFAEDDVLPRAVALGRTVRARLEGLQARHRSIVDVRGLGAMLAFECEEVASGPSYAQQIVAAGLGHGVILMTAGRRQSAVRLLIPLVATDDELARGLDALERACRDVLS